MANPDPRTTEIQARVDQPCRLSWDDDEWCDTHNQEWPATLWTCNGTDIPHLQAKNTELLATNARLQAQIDAVKALHMPIKRPYLKGKFCANCQGEGEYGETTHLRYPCATVQAITTASEGEE